MDKEIEKEKNSAPEGCTPSETRERQGRTGREAAACRSFFPAYGLGER